MKSSAYLLTIRKCAIVSVALCCGITSCKKQIPAKQPIGFNTERVTELNNYLKAYAANLDIPGLAVAIVSKDSVYQTALGKSDDKGAPFTTKTKFLTGSISEPLLALSILQLADEGKISLDEPVITYLPYFKMGGNSYTKITVRNLLTHTSGLQHYDIMWDDPDFKDNAPEITTRSISSQLPEFTQPGSKVKRSPYNFDILADLICKVTGKPFEQYVASHILNGLNMKSSTFLRPKYTAMPFKTGNWLTYAVQQDTLYPYNRQNGGSGGLHSSAEDMGKWMFALLNQHTSGKPNKQPLSTSVLQKSMLMEFKTGKNKGVGFGWDIDTIKGSKMYVKGSKYGGFSNKVILLPGRQVGVVVSSNISDRDIDPAGLCETIAAWLNGKSLTTSKIPVSMAMSKVFAKTGSMEQAIATFQKAQNHDKILYDTSPAILSQFGINLLHRSHDKENALKAFKFCVQQYPRSAYAYLNLAEGYIFMKDAANSRKALEIARSLPDDSGLKASYQAYLKDNLEILEEKKG